MADNHDNVISSNSIAISISILPDLPSGEVETFADADVFTDDAVETADGVVTPDGKMLVWGKNTLFQRTLTLAPTSKILKYINRAVLSANRRGSNVSEPSVVNLVVRNVITGECDTYLNGFIKSSQVGMSVGQERLNNREVVLVFSEVIPHGI